MIEWEVIENESDAATERAKVPGGWLVRTTAYVDAAGYRASVAAVSVSMVFVPEVVGEAWTLKDGA